MTTSNEISMDEKSSAAKIVENHASLEGAPVPKTATLELGLIISSVMMVIFVTTLDQTIVSTAVPKITDEFHGLTQVSWYGAVYFLTLGTFRAFWGKVCKYFPLKPTFLFTIALFELGSLICGVAPNSIALIVGRAIAGVGAAGAATAGTTIVVLGAPPRRRPMFLGLVGLAAALGNITGPLLGGTFSEKVTWRWCFYINLPIGGVVAGVILIFLRLETTTPDITWKETIRHMDIRGIILVLGGMISFILALQYGGVMYPWNSSEVIGLLVASVLIFAVLAACEISLDEYAMLPWRLIKQRALFATCLFQFFFAAAYFLILYYLPIYFQSILGFSPFESGVKSLPLVIPFGVAILVGGIAVALTGHATPFMAAGAVLTCVSTGLFYTMDSDTSPSHYIGYQVLSGIAIAFPYMNCLSLAQANVEEEDISIVTSIVQFFQTLGGAFSISAAQSAFINRLLAVLAEKAPELDPTSVTQTGAAELRTVFSTSELPAVISAYTQGLKAAFAICISVAGAAVLMTSLCPWSRLPTHGEKAEDATSDAA